MAGEPKSYVRGVLDGDVDASNITASERGKQVEAEIATQMVVNHAVNAAQWITPGAANAQPHQIATASPGSGGYQFDPETIEQRIKDWEKLLEDIEKDAFYLQAAWQSAKQPSPDAPAVKNAEDTRNSIAAAIDHNKAMQKYAQAWIDALRKANGTYVEHDQDTGEGLSGVEGVTDGSAL